MVKCDFSTSLLDLEEELSRCIRCGECRSVCPVFRELGEEKYTNRGRLALLREMAVGELVFSSAMAEILDNCIGCLSCSRVCGSGVNTHRIISICRAMAPEGEKKGLLKRLAYATLTHGGKTLSSAAPLQKILFKQVPQDSGFRRRFPLPLIGRDQYVPSLAAQPFRDAFPDFSPATGPYRDTVVFFTGCLINYGLVEVAEAVVKSLNQFGIDVIIPGEQVCCGAPQYIGGEHKPLKKLVDKNIAALSQRGKNHKIITPCASCSLMLKQEYPLLTARAQPLSALVYDYSQYLYEMINMEVLTRIDQSDNDRRITYHDPCHLSKGLSVTRQPREILRALAGDRFVEAENASDCCGSGGLYCLTHREVSQAILARKMKGLLISGADTIVTSCPACMVQLRDGVRRSGSDIKVTHIAELLMP